MKESAYGEDWTQIYESGLWFYPHLISTSFNLQIQRSVCFRFDHTSLFLYVFYMCVCVHFSAYVLVHCLIKSHGRASPQQRQRDEHYATFCRSTVKLCHKWSPEETLTDQKAEQEGEVSEHSDYYNLNPRKTPHAGEVEDLQITREENKQDADIDWVRVSKKKNN